MVVAGVSVGMTTIVLNLYPEAGPLQVVTHCAAGLCLAWVAAGFALAYRRPLTAWGTIGGDIQAVLRIAAIVLGLTAVIVMTYVAATEALRRTPYLFDYHARWKVYVWRSGLFDLGLVAAAVLLAWARIRDNQLITVCFWVLVLAGLWLALQLPAFRRVPIDSGGSYPAMTLWARPFMIWNALMIAGFSAIEAVRLHHRRSSAWPDALDKLVTPPPAWPGFDYSVGIVGVVTLILCCVHVVTVSATVSAFVAGVGILAMINRRWEENLADLGIGLISVGIASLPLLGVAIPEHVAAPWFANVFARLVIGLAIATVFWHWLASVWDQQLDNGRAWTTTGRLIRIVQRVGFLCGAAGVLVAMQLAFWPRFPGVQGLENTVGRWLWGTSAHVLLMGALTFAALRARKATLAWLWTFAAASLVAFVLIRLGDHPIAAFWSDYWPPVIAVLAGVALPIATAAYRSVRWRPFGEPLLLFGLLAGPLAAMTGIVFGSLQTMSPWLPPATFGLLACVYLVASVRPGPRTYLVPAIACALLSAWRLLQLTGSSTL